MPPPEGIEGSPRVYLHLLALLGVALAPLVPRERAAPLFAREGLPLQATAVVLVGLLTYVDVLLGLLFIAFLISLAIQQRYTRCGDA